MVMLGSSLFPFLYFPWDAPSLSSSPNNHKLNWTTSTMSTEDAHTSLKTVQDAIQNVQNALSAIQKSVNKLHLPLISAKDTVWTVAACLELPIIALNPFNFALLLSSSKPQRPSPQWMHNCFSVEKRSCSLTRTPPLCWKNLRIRCISFSVCSPTAKVFWLQIVIYGIEGAQGMNDYYVVMEALFSRST